MEQENAISIDPIKFVAKRGIAEIELSLVELRHLAYLVENRHRVVSTAEMFEAIWRGKALPHSNIVNVYIRYLRIKLGKEAIITVRGEGFKLAA